ALDKIEQQLLALDFGYKIPSDNEKLFSIALSKGLGLAATIVGNKGQKKNEKEIFKNLNESFIDFLADKDEEKFKKAVVETMERAYKELPESIRKQYFALEPFIVKMVPTYKAHSKEDVNFLVQLGQIEEKSKNLNTRSGNDKNDKKLEAAASSASTLSTALDTAYKKYYNGDRSPANAETFIRESREAIKTARPELETHRGWGRVLANVGLAIAGIGVLYGIALIANTIHTKGKHTFFYKTDSESKIEEVEKAIDAFEAKTKQTG
ncbi:unnamed protein product, partial [marine sediment metagenome]